MRSFGATARRSTVCVVLALAAGSAPVLVPGLAPAAFADEIRDRQGPMLTTLDVQSAWRVTRGAGVTVAVVDSGTDPRQADLAGSVKTGSNMLASIDSGTRPARLHGTMMASLIAGHGHGPGLRSGIIGVAPEAKILGIRALAEPEDASYRLFRSSEGADGAIARGVRYAADHGADVINLSLGRPNEDDPDERAAIGYAISKGVVVVAAAGNEGDKRRELDKDGFAPYSYPASYPGVISVAATTERHSRASFSNRNYSVLVSAPGSGLPVAGPGTDYYVTDGTSDSSALVSGIAALIRAKYRKLPPTLVAQAIIAGTRYGPSGTYSPDVGFGEVNAARALTAANTLTKSRKGSSGKPAGDRFGAGATEPVEVIPRPAWVTPTIVGVTSMGIAGAVVAIIIAVMLARRHPRRREPGFDEMAMAGGGHAMAGASTGPPAPGAYPPSQPRYWTPPGPSPSGPGPSGRPQMEPPAPEQPPQQQGWRREPPVGW